MGQVRLLCACCVGVFVYSATSLLFGNAGFGAYAYMLEQRDEIYGNVCALERITEKMKQEIDLLTNDEDTISIYAHELGYVREGEKLIKLADYRAPVLNAFQRYDSGAAISIVEKNYIPQWVCRICGALAGCAFFWATSYRKKRMTSYGSNA